MFRRLFGTTLAGGVAGARAAAYLDRSGVRGGDTAGAPDAGRAPVVADPLPAPCSDGLLAGTLIATADGWRPAEDLRPGDLVVTFDNGLRPLCATSRTTLVTPDAGPLPATSRPLDVPAGVLGNRRPLRLLPGQAVLIESDAAELRFGDAFALIPAAALHGQDDIARTAPPPKLDVVWLEFDSDEIVYAEGMTLLLCPRRQPRLVATAEALMAAGMERPYAILPPQIARSLLPSPSAGPDPHTA